jgi:hypothetical protein
MEIGNKLPSHGAAKIFAVVLSGQNCVGRERNTEKLGTGYLLVVTQGYPRCLARTNYHRRTKIHRN